MQQQKHVGVFHTCNCCQHAVEANIFFLGTAGYSKYVTLGAIMPLYQSYAEISLTSAIRLGNTWETKLNLGFHHSHTLVQIWATRTFLGFLN